MIGFDLTLMHDLIPLVHYMYDLTTPEQGFNCQWMECILDWWRYWADRDLLGLNETSYFELWPVK